MTQENGPATGQSGKAQIAVKQTDSLLNLDPRQALPVHPAAKELPPLSDEEYAALVASIDEHGLLDAIEAIATTEGYQVIEGVHRQRVCLELGEPLRFRLVETSDPYAYVEVRNWARRHCNSAQKRERIAAWLVRDPNQSDHVIAAKIGATHPTVGKVRAELEAVGTIPKLDRTLGTDGKSYQRGKPAEAEADAAEVGDEADDSWKNFPPAETDDDAEGDEGEAAAADEGDDAQGDDADEGDEGDEADDAEGDVDALGPGWQATRGDDADEPSAQEREAALQAKLSPNELAALDVVPSAQLIEVLAPKLSLDEHATIEAMRVRRLLGRAFADSELERLRASNHELERKCLALKSEVEELKEENAKLRAALATTAGEEAAQ